LLEAMMDIGAARLQEIHVRKQGFLKRVAEQYPIVGSQRTM
jgi:hypothetical protein